MVFALCFSVTWQMTNDDSFLQVYARSDKGVSKILAFHLPEVSVDSVSFL